jgi:hypothetical protein
MCPGKFENLHVLFLQLAKPRQETVTAVFTIVFWILLRLEVPSIQIILTDYFKFKKNYEISVSLYHTAVPFAPSLASAQNDP